MNAAPRMIHANDREENPFSYSAETTRSTLWGTGHIRSVHAPCHRRSDRSTCCPPPTHLPPRNSTRTRSPHIRHHHSRAHTRPRRIRRGPSGRWLACARRHRGWAAPPAGAALAPPAHASSLVSILPASSRPSAAAAAAPCTRHTRERAARRVVLPVLRGRKVDHPVPDRGTQHPLLHQPTKAACCCRWSEAADLGSSPRGFSAAAARPRPGGS